VRTKREEGKRLPWKQLRCMPILILLTRALNDNKDYTGNENSKFPNVPTRSALVLAKIDYFVILVTNLNNKSNVYKKRCLFVDNAKTETTTQVDLKTDLTNRITVN